MGVTRGEGGYFCQSEPGHKSAINTAGRRMIGTGRGLSASDHQLITYRRYSEKTSLQEQVKGRPTR